MAERLELAQLVQKHRMTQVEVGGRRIEARLDPQALTGAEPFRELGFYEDLVRSAPDDGQGVIDLRGRGLFHG